MMDARQSDKLNWVCYREVCTDPLTIFFQNQVPFFRIMAANGPSAADRLMHDWCASELDRIVAGCYGISMLLFQHQSRGLDRPSLPLRIQRLSFGHVPATMDYRLPAVQTNNRATD